MNAQEAMDLLRVVRRLKVLTAFGDFPLQWSLGAKNCYIDLRVLSPAAVAELTGLPVGPEGYVLLSDPSAATGSRWANPGTHLTTWQAAVEAAGGTFTRYSLGCAAMLSVAVQESTYADKMIYLLPLLGGNLAAARVPLVDTLGVGIATNANFLEADFDEATGLQGNGSTKYLDSLIKASELGTTNNGGLGYWETDIAVSGVSNVEPIGAYNNANTYRYVLDLRTNLESFKWGDPANAINIVNPASNSHYYGQRSSATLRELFRDGVSIGTNTTNDATSGASERNILIVGSNVNPPQPFPGRCGCAYMTDGTLTAAEVAQLHSDIDRCLIAPLGR